MPRLSSFYGIVVYMHFGDHPPAHFHATYGSRRARIALDGGLLDGALPARALALVRTWAHLHGDELVACWERVTRNEPPGTIAPLP